MLDAILKEIENSRGPLTVKGLSRKLDIEESAMEGMLEFLQRKGRLNLQRPGGSESCVGTCAGCSFLGGCFSKEKREKQ